MPLDDHAHAFVPYPDAPLANAASGPLAGLSFGAKDLIDIAGYPTGGGSPTVLALSGIKRRTAPTVQTLLDAGARFVGKTVTDELAFSMNGNNAHFGAPINGAAPLRITGGSSSGSASAVSSGLCDFALGTDTGGSVRAPANHCGLFGLRPTHGRISLEAVMDLSPSFDTCGWFARDIATFARVADVLLGADAEASPRRVRLLRADDVWPLAMPAAAAALQASATHVERVLGAAAPSAVALESFDAMYWHFRHLQGREAWLTDGPLIERYAPPLGPGVAERFAWFAPGHRCAGRRRAHLSRRVRRASRLAARRRRRADAADDARHRPAACRLRGGARELPHAGDPHALHRRPERLPATLDAAGQPRRCAPGPVAARGPRAPTDGWSPWRNASPIALARPPEHASGQADLQGAVETEDVAVRRRRRAFDHREITALDRQQGVMPDARCEARCPACRR